MASRCSERSAIANGEAAGLPEMLTTRRANAGNCDLAEVCSGTTAECPPDAVQSAGTACRAAAGPCDVAEVCTGAADEELAKISTRCHGCCLRSAGHG